MIRTTITGIPARNIGKQEKNRCSDYCFGVSLSALVKIVRGHGGCADLQWQYTVSFDGNYVIQILQCSFDEQKLLANERQAIVFEQVGSDDGVGDAGFILQAEEDESVSGAGTLACDDAAGNAHAASVFNVLQVAGALHALQLGAAVSHGMTPHRQAGAAKVSYQPLFVIHACQGRGGVALDNSFQQRPGSARGAFHLPQSVAAM